MLLDGATNALAASNNTKSSRPTFSTDGHTFFVNIQSPGLTFAIWGPFARKNAALQRQMGHAAPPKYFAPLVSDKLIAFSKKTGNLPARSSRLSPAWVANCIIKGSVPRHATALKLRGTDPFFSMI
ncbi:hypothetical protein [Bacillus sp. V5-8f]|uniref:hypothetical protein n=1 Tax=Bacillus sp. V5-8f TaxID=2053044 RepID=UPI001C61112B|nr:hypothetical protein [Bacillus sp. V5-8f]